MYRVKNAKLKPQLIENCHLIVTEPLSIMADTQISSIYG